MINTFNKYDKAKITKILGKKPARNVAIVAGAAFSFASADTILAWYALDNVGSGLQFLVPNAEEALRVQPDFTVQDALDIFAEADQAYELAESKVNQTARFNPLFWPGKKLVVKANQVHKISYELRRDNFIAKFT